MTKGRKLKFKVKALPYCFRVYFWEIPYIKQFLKNKRSKYTEDFINKQIKNKEEGKKQNE